jgi:hypothetical protein
MAYAHDCCANVTAQPAPAAHWLIMDRTDRPSTLDPGPVNADYPYVCNAGLLGGTAPGDQVGPQCKGSCPEGEGIATIVLAAQQSADLNLAARVHSPVPRILLSHCDDPTSSLRAGCILSPRKRIPAIVPERHILGRHQAHFG